MRKWRCEHTQDLLSWEPPKVEARFDPIRVRAHTPQAKVSKALSEALKIDGRSREEIATALSKQLGETVSRDSLDAWASEARETSNISAYRLMALAVVLNSKELLNEMLSDSEMIVVDRKYLPLIKRQLIEDQQERLKKMLRSCDEEMRRMK